MENILWALLLFWNVENCFAPFEMEKSATEESSYGKFSDSSKFRKWGVFNRKRDAIARTVALVAQENGRYPDLIGLAEVENRWVVKQIAENTILAAQNYGIVHNDSPDSRGIDVALLYRKNTFHVLRRRFIPITTYISGSIHEPISIISYQPDSNECTDIGKSGKTDTLRTREILYVKGVLRELDTLHIMVVHWPSKLGGKSAMRNRHTTARLVRRLCDSIYHTNGDSIIYRPGWHSPKIIVMGDFNAGDGDASLQVLTGSNSGDKAGRFNHKEQETATFAAASTEMGLLNDVGYEVSPTDSQVHGTYKYRGEWETIDRFYVSRYFLEQKEVQVNGACICSHPSLLEKDKVYLGVKPKRCFVGPRYNGGVSDHLPVVLKLLQATL